MEQPVQGQQEETPDVLSYYPKTPPSRLGRHRHEHWHSKPEKDPNWDVVSPSIHGRSCDCARVVYCVNEGTQQQHPVQWFFERQDKEGLKLEPDENGKVPEDVASAFLPSMLNVKSTGKGGLFSPTHSLKINAETMLEGLQEVMHSSHKHHPPGARAKGDMKAQGGHFWEWKLPWRIVGQRFQVDHAHASPCGGSSSSNSSSSYGSTHGSHADAGCSGARRGVDGEPWSAWLCNTYSKCNVESSRAKNGGLRSIACLKQNRYLQVLLGYSYGKAAPVYEYAHRIVLWAFCGPPPARDAGQVGHKIAMHACDNPACLCVAHLSWGNPIQNNHHVVKKQKACPSVRRQLQF